MELLTPRELLILSFKGVADIILYKTKRHMPALINFVFEVTYWFYSNARGMHSILKAHRLKGD